MKVWFIHVWTSITVAEVVDCNKLQGFSFQTIYFISKHFALRRLNIVINFLHNGTLKITGIMIS